MKSDRVSDLPTNKPDIAKTLIVHVTVGLDVGGAERFLCRLIESHIHSPQFKHKVISLTSKGTLGPKLEGMGVEVTSMGMRNLFHAPLVFFKVLKKLRHQRPDVVQCWMYYADLIGGISARLVGAKMTIWGIRNSEFEGGGTLLKKVIRKLCAYLSWIVPTQIVCVAQSALNVHKAAGYNSSRMVVISNGYELGKYSRSLPARQSIRAEVGVSDEEIVVGSVGRYSKAKDHASFIAAATKAASFNARLRFILIGRDLTIANAELKRLLAASGIENRFILLGERNDISECMSAMDIFCLHSATEGFPNVLGEAMCVGLPCITTDVGDAKYLLGKCGITVEPKNTQALADAIVLFSEMDPEKRMSMGQQARSRIEKQFTLDRAVEAFENIYLRSPL